MLAATVSVAFWFASPSLRERVHHSINEFREYGATNKATPTGQHLAFLKESLTIIFFDSPDRPRHRVDSR